MSTPNLPSAEQIAENRKNLWHQDNQPLLTLEGLRAWVGRAGLVLYAPRAAQLPAPAPSLAEAVLGNADSAMTLEEMGEARTLLARLVGEGSVVPLNLLGTTSEVPDHVCSAAVFSYVFTLRGDKAWKQAPATSGAVKVSPLALAAYEALGRGVTMSAAELVSELGKEVTETAVLRGLSELWSHLRVLPIPQVDGPTRWELMSTRYTKQIKAGANAGQPTALSALISLYLGMAVVATEEEVETILSPLAPRSRIRDVVHALMGARELDTIAIDGRTVVHVAGDLPSFAVAEAMSEAGMEVSASAETATEDAQTPEQGASGRISTFVAKPKKVGTGFVKPFQARPAGERERRPFVKKSFGGDTRGGDAKAGFSRPSASKPGFSKPGYSKPGFGKPDFQKPWDEERKARPAAGDGAAARPSRPGFSRTDGGTRPTFRRDAGEGGPPARPGFAGAGDRGARKTFSKPGTFGRKREERAGGPGFGGGEGRPPRRDAGADRSERGAGPGERPRSFSRGAAGGERSASGGERRPGSYSARPQGAGFAGKRPVTSRDGDGPKRSFSGGGAGNRAGARGQDGASGEGPSRKIYRKFDAPREPRDGKPSGERRASEKRPFEKPRGARPFGDRAGASDRPTAGDRRPGAKKAFSQSGSKPAGSKPLGTFAKFADGAKPFRKQGPGGKKFGGGKPTPKGTDGEYRKRKPEGDGAA